MSVHWVWRRFIGGPLDGEYRRVDSQIVIYAQLEEVGPFRYEERRVIYSERRWAATWPDKRVIPFMVMEGLSNEAAATLVREHLLG